MAKFLTSNELNSEVEKLFEKANDLIIIISPYIKLHERYISALKSKIDNHRLEIIVVFGKNEDDKTKSISFDNFTFLKTFPNIQIRYEKRLHAKYYANESSAILTSMNLYSYSQDNNIEAGIKTKSSIMGDLSSMLGEEALDSQTWNYFQKVIDQSELLFQKKPQYESQMLGLTKKYTTSTIVDDKLSAFFSKNNDKTTFYSPPIKSGYCIRTGKEIPFNPTQPFSKEAYQSWIIYSNEEYPEKYCHYSGLPSNGQTTKAKPILREKWNEARATFNL
jgi:hypothetical protein